MAENDNVPYKEQEDGSILAKVGLDENEQFEEETRLSSTPAFMLEFERTKEILGRHLPQAPGSPER